MITIDLSGPQGNAFFLMGQAQRWAKDLGRDPNAIVNEMQEGDYDHLLSVFRREFCEGPTAVCNLVGDIE